MGGKDWESEVLKWQMLFGNEQVLRVDLEDSGILWRRIPVGLFERNEWRNLYRLKPLEERNVVIRNIERQYKLLAERVQDEQSGKSKTW